MEFLSRTQNKLYKTYKKCTIEYHAGGFFIRKEAVYISILTDNSMIIFRRNEGLHPLDDDYSSLASNELFVRGEKFSLFNCKQNIAIYKNKETEVKITPSVFAENLSSKGVTELLVDWGGDNVQIFSLVLDLSQ